MNRTEFLERVRTRSLIPADRVAFIKGASDEELELTLKTVSPYMSAQSIKEYREYWNSVERPKHDLTSGMIFDTTYTIQENDLKYGFVVTRYNRFGQPYTARVWVKRGKR